MSTDPTPGTRSAAVSQDGQQAPSSEQIPLDEAHALLIAAHKFWNVDNRAGAVQWVQGQDGELVIFTRGEYRKTLMKNIDELEATPSGDAQPVAPATPPASVPAAPSDELIDRLARIYLPPNSHGAREFVRALSSAVPAVPSDAMEVLRELIDTTRRPMPPFEAGKDAQTAWAERHDKAVTAARALLNEKEPP